MPARVLHRAGRSVPLLVALLLAAALVSIPVPPSTAVAPVAPPVPARVAAAVPEDLLANADRWPVAPASRPAPIQAAQAAALREALERARARFGMYGAQLAVSWDGGATRWSGAAGIARDAHTPLTGEEELGIGSVTKTFTAALILELVEEGRVSLDERVRHYLPGLPHAAGVTVRQLLNHTSGIADLYYPLVGSLLAQPDRVWKPRGVLRRIGSSWFEPGTHWAYSNTNYVVLGMLAEAVTGRPVEREISERFLLPLGLSHTRLSHGGEILPTSWATAFWTAGGVTSTASDLARWGDALYGGSVLSTDALDDMLAFRRHHYGLGARSFKLKGHRAVGHTGMLATYTAILVHLPREQVTIALISNRSQVDIRGMLTTQVGGQPSILQAALSR